MKRGFRGVGALLVLFVAAGGLRADDPQHEIATLSKAYDAALKARDTKALGKLFDDDGQFVLPDGRLMDKWSYIARLTRASVTIDTAESTIGSIRVFGDTAIESGTWTATATEEGKPKTARERYTAVWVKKTGTWVLTAEHVTAIPDEKK
jgi:uncharacterized protein (TIGR02246 family)